MSVEMVFARQKLPIVLLMIISGLVQVSTVRAQISAPEFLCVQNDTLRWNAPASLCGGFNSYLIYGSQDPSGPYSVLATITDQDQFAYFHADAGNQTWYYYLESDLDCPGQPPLQSDTLDNLIPDPGPIKVVTVVDESTVRIDWSSSPSPEVIGYIVSRQNALGTTILDTVYNSFSYTDINASPADQSETYFVVALDPCGNVSLVPDPHKTILLELGSVDSCSQAITLNWSAYINWPNGVDRYEILVSETAPTENRPGSFGLVAAVDDAQPSYTFVDAVDGRNFFFKIRGVEEDTNEESFSNEIMVTVGAVQAVQDLVLESTQVGPDNITVQWQLQPQVPTASAMLLRSEDGMTFSPVSDIDPTAGLYVDMTSLGNQKPVSYRIEAVDQCGNEIVSNAISTIYISGEPNGNNNEVTWTAYYNEAGQALSYELYRATVGGATTLLATNPSTTLNFSDPVDLTDPAQTTKCYSITANTQVTLSSQVVTAFSTSNIVCLEQSAQLFIPNAFVPDGVNRIFKPILQFGGTQEYLMTIYDRYGGVVFESRELTTGWDGKKNGRPLPQGMYVYLIRMKQGSGQEIEKKGMVMLLR
ncbi:MAG: gliding motility-associated C-terminal domain-containing protein [Lewinella sp.]|nr:gliding motility-associated C-terminal domain-containing protein [Lewinella sp.]